jgi:hypothetical protein
MSVFNPPAASRRICGPKARNMWPKDANMCPTSTEYVAETRGYASEKHRICGGNTRNMCPKSIEYVAGRFVVALHAVLLSGIFLPFTDTSSNRFQQDQLIIASHVTEIFTFNINTCNHI